VYGIDVNDDDMLARRSWRWLNVRIAGLLDRPPAYVAYGEGQVAVVPTTRLGFALRPPQFE
jgi:hypothetical protein